MVDTHCHLTEGVFAGEIARVITGANEQGVMTVVVCGTDMDSSRGAVEIAGKNPGVWATVGVHPEAIDRTDLGSGFEERLVELAKNPQVVAIGECGVDKKVAAGTVGVVTQEIKRQTELFKAQVGIAVIADLPVVVHNRGAEEEVLSVLREFDGKVKGVMHCFSGGAEWLKTVLDLGFYVSFAGNVTFTGSAELCEATKTVPVEKLLIETDSPYLTPEPYRGKWPNVPANAKIVLEFVAELRNIPANELEKIVDKNARTLFERMI